MNSSFWRCRNARSLGKATTSGILLSLSLLCGLHASAQSSGRGSRTPAGQPQPIAVNAPLASAQLPPLVPGQTAIPGDILVGVAEGADDRVVASHFQQLGQAMGHSAHLHAFRVRLNAGITDALALEWLRHQTGVAYAENNHRVQVAATPNDASYSAQWALPKIQADQAWTNWKPQGQVIIAIVDTGVDSNHPDLTNVMFKDTAGNVVGHDSTGSGSFLDGFGHGTHCAGIAAAQINNSTSYFNSANNTNYGIAGVVGWNGDNSKSDTSHIKIMPVRVLDSSGSGSDSQVADGIEWAADHGAKVISLSLGEPEDPANPGPPSLLNAAVQYAWSKGIVVVAAAGNSSTNAHFYPAACPNVVSVAATDSNDTLASFSNYGDWVTTAAPGVNIFSTLPTYNASAGWGTYYTFLSGTSMATPHVAGEAAMLFAQKIGLTAQQVHDTIISSVNPVNGSNTISGGAGGRVNFLTALNAVGASAPGSQSVYQIDAGGGAVGTFAADAYYSGGGFPYSTPHAVDLSGVTNPAPMAAYQSVRTNYGQGDIIYTLPNLTPAKTYTVRLHFQEMSESNVGGRLFNVSINGTQVLTNFDQLAAAGAMFKATIQQFSVPADSGGRITLTFHTVRQCANIAAIEVLDPSSAPPVTLPATPTNLTATPGTSQITLQWTASPTATSYNIKGSTALSGPFVTIATLQSGTVYTDGGTNFDGSNRLANGTTYYYIVTAMNSAGESAASNTTSATPNGKPSQVTYQIDAGGGAVGTFAADAYYSGGGFPYSTPHAVDLSGVTNPAPMAAYQSVRTNYGQGDIIYTLPNLTPAKTYTVRLHFQEMSESNVGGRLFNVSINGTQVLTNFDQLAAAGAMFKATIQQFSVPADSGGRITLTFHTVRQCANIAAIEVQ